MEELKTDGIANPGDDFTKLTALGYQALYDENDPQKAMRFFRWNPALFPDEPDLLDSLAEGHLQAVDRRRAIETYAKALKLNPNLKSNAAEIVAKLKSDPDSLSALQQKARKAYRQAFADSALQQR